MLYTRSGSYPAALPYRIRLSDGRTRTNPSTFTEEEIADAGYAEAPEMPVFNPETHYVDWSGTDWVVLPIAGAVALDPQNVIATLWNSARAKRDKLLLASDWRVISALEKGVEIDAAWKTYRQALRDITLQADPNDIAWPVAPA